VIVISVDLVKELAEGGVLVEVDEEDAELLALDVVDGVESTSLVAVLDLIPAGGLDALTDALGGVEGADDDGLAVEDFVDLEDVTETLVDLGERDVTVAVHVDLTPELLALLDRFGGAVIREHGLDLGPVDLLHTVAGVDGREGDHLSLRGAVTLGGGSDSLDAGSALTAEVLVAGAARVGGGALLADLGAAVAAPATGDGAGGHIVAVLALEGDVLGGGFSSEEGTSTFRHLIFF